VTQVVLVAPAGFGYPGFPGGQYQHWIRQPPIQHAVHWEVYFDVSGQFMHHEIMMSTHRNMTHGALYAYLYSGA